MTESLEVTFLPASNGDAIHIRWPGHHMFVDMGRITTGRSIAKSLRENSHGAFELLVVTHVDVDHIGGVISFLTQEDGQVANDIWFNGFQHLPDPNRRPHDNNAGSTFETWAIKHGFELEMWLRARPHMPWNNAFGRKAVILDPEGPTTRPLPGGVNVTVIGPPERRLEALRDGWKKHIDAESECLRDGDPQPAAPKEAESWGDELPNREALAKLAAAKNTKDTAANGSSIALIVEWEGRRLLLAGDAFPDDLVKGIDAAGGDGTFDLVKLPHHGSKNNVTEELLGQITTDNWVICTNGAGRHRHPDQAAIARILLPFVPSPTQKPAGLTQQHLVFNVPSAVNEFWNSPKYKKRFNYRTTYGTPDEGATIVFQPKR